MRSSAGPRTTPSPTEPRTIRSPEPTRPNFEPPPPPIVQDIPRQRQSRPMVALGLGLGLALITLVAGLLLWDRLATRQDVVQPPVQVAEKPSSPAPAKPVVDTAISPPVLVNLALYHLAAGDLTVVEAELQRVNAMLGSLKPQNLPIETLDTLNHLRVDLLAGLASQGDPQPASAREHWGRAVTIINFIVAPGERAQALSGLARGLRGRDPASAETHFNSAIATARNTPDPATRVLALSAVARDLAEADRLKQADELFRQAMETAESLTESNPQLTALGAIAKYRAETGDSALAQILLDRIATALTGSRAWPSPALLPDQLAEYGLEAQGALARNLALGGNEAEARTEFAATIEQATTLKDPERRARVNLYLARCLVEMGKRDQAAHLVAAVTQELKTRRPPD